MTTYNSLLLFIVNCIDCDGDGRYGHSGHGVVVVMMIGAIMNS